MSHKVFFLIDHIEPLCGFHMLTLFSVFVTSWWMSTPIDSMFDLESMPKGEDLLWF